MFEAKYNEEDQILYLVKEGKFRFKDLQEVMNALNDQFGEQLNKCLLLEDSRKSSYSSKISEIPLIVEELKRLVEGREEVRHADIVTNPLDTAFSFVYNRLVSGIKNYHYKVFSTEEAAKKWLKK